MLVRVYFTSLTFWFPFSHQLIRIPSLYYACYSYTCLCKGWKFFTFQANECRRLTTTNITHTHTQLKTVAYMNVTPSEMLLSGRRSRMHSSCSTTNHQSLFRLVTPNFHRITCPSLRFVSMLPRSALQEADTALNVLVWGLCPQCVVHNPVAACSACVNPCPAGQMEHEPFQHQPFQTSLSSNRVLFYNVVSGW